ncbi:MAG TPA: PD-(D/E)XK nuclease family protein [Elusimicrobiota bacterium]|nr:PD-(D/E)XK nuclease family protein [Elusimicrobiota bacterium]
MKIISVSSEFPTQAETKLITISRVRDAQCPLRYYKNFLEKPRQEPLFIPIELGMGGFFHDYLEKHLKLVMNLHTEIDKHHRIDVNDMLRSFRMSFVWEGKLRPPYKIVLEKLDVEDYVSKLRGVGQNFNDFLMEELPGKRILGVEEPIQLRTEKATLYGKYDLITEDSDGSITLWDWKTNILPGSQSHEEFRNQKIQLGMYAIWLKYKYDLDKVRATAVFFGDKTEQVSEMFSDEVERDVLTFLTAWRDKLNKLDSYPPLPNKSCPWCEWYPVCPAFATGRKPAPAVREGAASPSPSAAPLPFAPRRPEHEEHLLALVLGVVLALALAVAMFFPFLQKLF